MVPYWTKWSQLVSNGPKWYPMLTNFTKFYPMVISHTNESMYVGKMVKYSLERVKFQTGYLRQKFLNFNQGNKGGPLKIWSKAGSGRSNFRLDTLDKKMLWMVGNPYMLDGW